MWFQIINVVSNNKFQISINLLFIIKLLLLLLLLFQILMYTAGQADTFKDLKFF